MRTYLILLALPLAAAQLAWVGSRVCTTCHAEIYRTYSATPMALSSGAANSVTVPA